MTNKEIQERFGVLFDLVNKFQNEIGTFPDLTDESPAVLVPALSNAINELPETTSSELSNWVEKLQVQLARFNNDMSSAVVKTYPLNK